MTNNPDDFLDDFTTRYCLPIGGFLTAIFAGWYMSSADSAAGMGAGGEDSKLYKIWKFLIQFITPALVGVTILNKIFQFSGGNYNPKYPQLEKCTSGE